MKWIALFSFFVFSFLNQDIFPLPLYRSPDRYIASLGQEDKISQVVQEIHKKLLNERYKEADEEIHKLLKFSSNSKEISQVYYLKIYSLNLQNAENEVLRKSLKDMEKKYQSSNWFYKASFILAQKYRKEGYPNKAFELYKQISQKSSDFELKEKADRALLSLPSNL